MKTSLKIRNTKAYFVNTIVFCKLAFAFLEDHVFSIIVWQINLLEMQKQVFKIQLYLQNMLLYFLFLS